MDLSGETQPGSRSVPELGHEDDQPPRTGGGIAGIQRHLGAQTLGSPATVQGRGHVGVVAVRRNQQRVDGSGLAQSHVDQKGSSAWRHIKGDGSIAGDAAAVPTQEHASESSRPVSDGNKRSEIYGNGAGQRGSGRPREGYFGRQVSRRQGFDSDGKAGGFSRPNHGSHRR